MKDKISRPNWVESIPKIPGRVTGLVAFVTTIVGFVRLWQGDAGLVTIVLISVGTIGLWLGSAYVAYKRTPPLVEGGKGQPAFPGWRRLALIGFIAIPLITAVALGGWWYYINQPPDKVIVMVAEIDGPDPKKYRVTEIILKNLRDALADEPKAQVKYLAQAITETQGSEEARRQGAKPLGKQDDASIAIWGWYGVTEEAVSLSVHFELLRPPKDMPELGPNLKGGIQTVTIAELESIALQSRLAAGMAGLSLFTIGMTRYAVQDWQGAIDLFDDALGQTADRMPRLEWGIYFYRGNARLYRGDFDQAIEDYRKSIDLEDDHAEAYNNCGNAYAALGDYNQAVRYYDKAIELRHDYAEAFNNRSVAYYALGDYNLAVGDCKEAIKWKPDYAVAYNNCGNAYAALGDYNQAIFHYDNAIELEPNYVKAHNNRVALHVRMGEYDEAIDNCRKAIKWKPDYVRVYYWCGTAHKLRDEKEEAVKYFERVLELSEDEELSKNAEKQLRDLGRQ
jgi:tetratricopeptide (TPR) repeat protein